MKSVLTVLLCFTQVPHNINFREKKSKLKKDKKAESGGTEENSGVKGRIARFRYFEDISGYSGVRKPFLKIYFIISNTPKISGKPFNSPHFPVGAGIYLRPVSSLDVGHLSGGDEASSNDHRWLHRVFLPLP